MFFWYFLEYSKRRNSKSQRCQLSGYNENKKVIWFSQKPEMEFWNSYIIETLKMAQYQISKTKLHGFSPQANYTDRATVACRRS
jgi:hypothetical protein